MIAKYLENTHATTHNQYHMELLDVFALEHEKKAFTDVGNRYVFHIFHFNCSFASERFCHTVNYKQLLDEAFLWYLEYSRSR